MKFINKGKDVKVRTGKRFRSVWITVRKGETVDLPKSKGKKFGLEKVPNGDQKLPEVTEGKIGEKKVETKQLEKPLKKKTKNSQESSETLRGLARRLWRTFLRSIRGRSK